MKLGEKQELFARLLPLLIGYMQAMGYQVRIGAVERKEGGHPNSLHKVRLAADLNLFWEGVYLTDTASHEKFGIFWEGLHDLCRWGGRFDDGNHYSITHDGMK